MYKIEKSNVSQLLHDYITYYKPIVRPLIEKYYNGYTFEDEVGTSNVTKVDVGAFPGSYLHTFLGECLQDDSKIDLLLGGTFAEQKQFIKELKQNDPLALKSGLTYVKYPHLRKTSTGVVEKISDFNTVFKRIFVEGIFEAPDDDSNHMLKLKFIQEMGLYYCPYCGDTIIEDIKVKTKNGYTYVKPVLDHFLPKSKYPFFAMNFWNLIPCCEHCNSSLNKGANDPLGKDSDNYHLMQPHEFDGSKFDFTLTFDPLDFLDENKIKVEIDYKGNDELKVGYTDYIYVENFYNAKNKKSEISDWIYYMSSDCDAKRMLDEDLGVKLDYWDNETACTFFKSPRMIDKYAMYIRNYKFKIDLYKYLHDYFRKELKR